MYHWRIFLWEKGHKSTEYTDYVTAPIFLEDRLDETLDTGEIVLKSMPISSRSAFPPKTKFRLERYLTADYTDEPKTWDMVVDHDDVEEYEGCPEICTHRIFLIEASVIAQGMHVDNIALTYQLQDVTLNYKTIKDITGAVIVEDKGTNTNAIQSCPQMISVRDEVNSGQVATVSFVNSYRYVWTNFERIKALKKFYHANVPIDLVFDLPTLTAQGAKNGGWIDICEVPVEASVVLEHLDRANNVLDTIRIDRKYGPSSFPSSSADERIYKYGTLDTYGTSFGEGTQICGATSINIVKSSTSGLFQSLNDLMQFEDRLSVGVYPSMPISYIDSAFNNSKVVNITIPRLTDEQMTRGEKYKLTISAKATSAAKNNNQWALPVRYECKCDVAKNTSGDFQNNSEGLFGNDYNSRGYAEYISVDYITFYTDIMSQDQRQDKASYEFMRKKAKNNCYDLLRKAILSCDTYVITGNSGIDSLPLPIEASKETHDMLTATSLHETIFEQKNLWEILLQIGYYTHSIPYLEFATEGDYFILNYKRLGSPEIKPNDSVKITVFNSLNLSDYFTQYDSYVTNMFSPQNIVSECGVVKTSSNDYLVSNNTAEIHTKYPIIELLKFEIKRGDSGEWSDITKYVFEKAIYSVLSAYVDITPSKGNSIYYTLGDNKILGLDYVPSTANGDVPLYAFKEIIKNATGSYSFYNNYKYRIQYRTQDSLRVSQFRPDLHKFIKNSERETYPHHEQFYGQQDKIVDSERFSANLFGKLIRVGNAVYQQQEYATAGSEKVSGDLIEINGEPYYVTACENEYYADVILQKVTYSKNFNQLSNIVTIPSEPRFYEVSERSSVRREVRLNDFLLLTTKESNGTGDLKFAESAQWKKFVKGLVFGDGAFDIPNYAFVRFKDDASRHNDETYKVLFPSSQTRRIDQNTIAPIDSKSYSSVAVPALMFPMKNSIAFEWDMDDNFKAGDFIDKNNSGGKDDDAYLTMQSARYCDLFGGADLFDFALFEKSDWTIDETRKLPLLEQAPSKIFGTKNNNSVVLNKDNREALSFNYQINFLQDEREFVTFSNLFGNKKGKLKMCFLNQEVGYLSETVELSNRTILVDNVEYSIATIGNAIKIIAQGTTTDDLKAIVLYEEDGTSKYPCIARNVGKYAKQDKLREWYICPIFTN